MIFLAQEEILSPTLTDEEFEDKLRSLRSAAKGSACVFSE